MQTKMLHMNVKELICSILLASCSQNDPPSHSSLQLGLHLPFTPWATPHFHLGKTSSSDDLSNSIQEIENSREDQVKGTCISCSAGLYVHMGSGPFHHNSRLMPLWKDQKKAKRPKTGSRCQKRTRLVHLWFWVRRDKPHITRMRFPLTFQTLYAKDPLPI